MLDQTRIISELFYVESDIKAFFGEETLKKAKSILENSTIEKVCVNSDSRLITATIRSEQTYSVSIEIKKESELFHTTCSCSQKTRCHHAASTLLYLLNQPKSSIEADPTSSRAWTSWADHFNKIKKGIEDPASQETSRLLYILENKENEALIVRISVAKVLRKGGFGALKDFSRTRHEKYLLKNDSDIFYYLRGMCLEGDYLDHFYVIGGPGAKDVLQLIIQSGRAFWESTSNTSLTLTEKKDAAFCWETRYDGFQKIYSEIDEKKVLTFHCNPLWYVCLNTMTSGPVSFPVEDHIASHMLSAPPIPPENSDEIRSLLVKTKAQDLLPAPKTIQQSSTTFIQPKLLVHISQKKLYEWQKGIIGDYAVALVSFLYDNLSITVEYRKPYITKIENNSMTSIQRNTIMEEAFIKMLNDCGLSTLKSHNIRAESPESLFLIGSLSNHHVMNFFMETTLPKFYKKNFQITFDEDFPLRPTVEIDDWYMDIEEDAKKYNWFDLEIGVSVNGTKINLLPILLDVIKRTNGNIEEVLKDKKFYIGLPDNTRVALPMKRLEKILTTLTELFNTVNTEKIALPKARLADLFDLKKDLGKVAMQATVQNANIEAMANQLKIKQGYDEAKIPIEFQATLRQYQKEGLNWLQFLRQHNLGGILADDMGLGKTIQALAHIAIEKKEERMAYPTLIIAPTSLMVNWENEAKRFTPHLKVLVLHGDNRNENYDAISKHDIVLTTYPLVVRDEKILLENKYHYLILDEAQFIKNHKTKTYQIIENIHSQHKLCLTGTPLENHYGELWSLFNIVSPGFLGNAKLFNQHFRIPIEKLQNKERQKMLTKRIAPFLLRRTKDEVAQDLPEKTELIHRIELHDQQKDLYEAVRLSMEKKVLDALGQKGLNKSHIIILDALLKLRQICCDPRLVKIENAKNCTSAKLEYLIEMVQGFLENKRHILIFSSFTSMLDIISEELTQKNIPHVVLTGQTKDRKTPVETFQDGKVPIFLISLKAGGTGLNLTKADTVIHYDPWWNPAAENQATDRAHRIGQKKPVFVYKLVTAGSVEEKILLMQEHKKARLDSLFSEDASSKTGQLSTEDVEYLLKTIDSY